MHGIDIDCSNDGLLAMYILVKETVRLMHELSHLFRFAYKESDNNSISVSRLYQSKIRMYELQTDWTRF